MFPLAQSEIAAAKGAVDQLHNMYGWAAFGLVAVIVLVAIFVIVWQRIAVPSLRLLASIQSEQTKQAEIQKVTAQSMERTSTELKVTAQFQAQQTESLALLSTNLHRTL